MAILLKDKKISNFIRQVVAESMQGILADKELGISFKKAISARLNKYSKTGKTKLSKVSSLSQIKKKYL
ncbi:MAG: hypothetical protein Q8P06_01590 [Candidatus Azambacteria bacterium]|nr:hypothetical protein [Candidatus Azambacteria bacterium]